MSEDAVTADSRANKIASYLEQQRDLNLERVAALVRIPSVSRAGSNHEAVRDSAAAVQRFAEDIGLVEARIMEVAEGLPSVYAAWGDEPDLPTVLLYAHHDVQPPGTISNWTSDPFTPTVREGRLYGRGSSDDKAGVVVHIAAIEAWLKTLGELPVNVRVFIDGEEECGNPSLPHLLAEEAPALQSDVLVVADSMNWTVGQPAITRSLRGAATLAVELRALDKPVHSGIYGGAVPDSLMAMSRLLASLVDEAGDIAVSGLFDDLDTEADSLNPPEVDPVRLRAFAGLRDGVQLVGDVRHSIANRLWTRPSLSVIGLDAPSVASSSNTIQASARAAISMRLGPGQDPDRAIDALAAHLRARVPWGLEISLEPGSKHRAWHQTPVGPVFSAAERALEAAYGTPPVYMGLGGTVPLVTKLSETFTGIPCLVTGIEDPESRAHGDDESVVIDDFHRACLAEALFFQELAVEMGK